MKRTLLPLLCCPVCKGDLHLTVLAENEKEILEGTLKCQHCEVDYPIQDAIPDLLPRRAGE